MLVREQALVTSLAAWTAGVRPGMRRSGILSLCPDALLHERDESAEGATLDAIAQALMRYTPEVALGEETTLLLDVSASLRVFGGRRALCRQVCATVEALGFTLRIGMAPTAQGAWLLARYPHTRHPCRQRRTVQLCTLARRLHALPYDVLPALRPFAAWLEGIGCRSLQDVRRLPRAGLKRRTHARVLHALDCAYGEEAELFEWVQPPAEFHARLELPERVEQAEALLFAARRLLLQMTGWLVARQLAVARFTLTMEHERGRTAIAPTLLEIGLAEPAWQEPHLLRLLKERLARLQLQAPVIALRLEAAKMEQMAPPNASLFPDPGGTPADFKRLLELLSARLGEQAVLTPAPQADYRPQACNQWQAATTARPSQPAAFPPMQRPFWLLPEPIPLAVHAHRPFYRTPLHLVSPPERIECGWWDGQLLVRDYFIACGEGGMYCWVYREREGEQVYWSLEGMFA